MTLSDCNYLAHVIVLWHMRALSKYKPPEAYIRRGDLTEHNFCITRLRGLYLEELIHGGAYFGILRYLLSFSFDFHGGHICNRSRESLTPSILCS